MLSRHDQSGDDHLKDEMRRLIYLFTHDMRNPLVNMKALLNELRLTLQRAQCGDPRVIEQELPDTMQMLDLSVERMSAVIEGANDICHCMFDPLECEEIELTPLIKRILHRFGDIEGVEIQVAEMATIWADPLAVGRMVEELLKNSIRAVGAQGSIALSLNRQAHFDELMITDSGEGVPEGSLESLFDPFYSVAGQQGSTAGMGLALVKALAEAHGGSVRCEPKQDKGLTFYVSFPRREGPTAA